LPSAASVPQRLCRLWGRRARRDHPASAARHGHVAFLNDLVGLPSPHAGRVFAGRLDVDTLFLDYNYRDRRKTEACLGLLARARRERGLDFSTKTLLLAARGLDPDHGALLDFVREFKDHHVFFELWNTEAEVAELYRAELENLYFLPVTAALRLPLPEAPAPWPARPNRRVFVSLGGDDDLDLVGEVIRRRDDLHFFVPDLAWHKPNPGRREFAVHIPGRNVTGVPCASPQRFTVTAARGLAQAWWTSSTGSSFTPAYRLAYAACDTVLVATRAEKRQQMRGGIRVADALAARKRLVLAKNSMCELLMAQHEKTALVADHDAESISAALDRVGDGSFAVDHDLYEEIRALTCDDAKAAWMMGVPLDPDRARRSAFRRDPARIRRDLMRLAPAVHCPPLVATLFGLTQGQALSVPDAALDGGSRPQAPGVSRIAEIRLESDTSYEVTLTRAGARPLVVVLSTAPVERYYRRTARGHYLSYRGSGVTPGETSLLEQVARLV
jgi:hypothetical protein